MSESSGLRGLVKSGDPAAIDEGHLLNDEPLRASPEPRFTRFMPAPRGRIEPSAGTVGDREAVHALAVGGGGWLHTDGRIVANGSASGTSALRVIPEMVPLLDRLEAEVAAVEASRRSEREAMLADYLASGRTEDEFHFDDADHDYAAQIAADHPGPDVEAELGRAGWISLDLRRDRGVKEIRVTGQRSASASHDPHLSVLADLLGARLDFPFRRAATPEPGRDLIAGPDLSPEQADMVDHVMRTGKLPDGLASEAQADDENSLHNPSI
ncbi:hypothetical protein CLBKND_01598 [Methylorubrum aminovorans]